MWEVRVPKELRTKEGHTRRYFPRQNLALGYCQRLKTDLLYYSDKARGLTDAQKIEATKCFELLTSSPGASLVEAVKQYLVRREQSVRSVTVSHLLDAIISTKVATGGRGSAKRTLEEIRSRFGRFARDFGER